MAEHTQSKQEEIYKFIKRQLQDKGYPPSVREICGAVGLKSTSTVHGHLSRMEKKGLIKRDPTKPRTIELTEDIAYRKEMVHIPLIGKVTAGSPVLAVENIENTFTMPLDFVRSNKDLFMLRVHGESMIEAGILDNDLVILERTGVADDGDIVVALIENEVTLKRFFMEKNHIRLQPENKNMEPIIVKNCSVLGRLVGLYRKY